MHMLLDNYATADCVAQADVAALIGRLFCTGTERENYTSSVVQRGNGNNAKVPPMRPKFRDVRTMMKTARGTWDYSFDVNEILAVRWNDNSVVPVLTNHLKYEPGYWARRFDRKKKKKWAEPKYRIRSTNIIERWVASIYSMR